VTKQAVHSGVTSMRRSALLCEYQGSTEAFGNFHYWETRHHAVAIWTSSPYESGLYTALRVAAENTIPAFLPSFGTHNTQVDALLPIKCQACWRQRFCRRAAERKTSSLWRQCAYVAVELSKQRFSSAPQLLSVAAH
jgi:hypothetical protein